MNTRRPGRDDVGMSNERESEALILASSTIRPSEPVKSRDQGHPDERLSLFWRVFGGTILSICALVAISLYNNLANSITELRGELSRVNEARGEMVKKEEFNSRTQSMWDRVQTLQEMKVAFEEGVMRAVLLDNGLKSDMVHPNEAGYARIAAAVEKLLKKSGAI